MDRNTEIHARICTVCGFRPPHESQKASPETRRDNQAMLLRSAFPSDYSPWATDSVSFNILPVFTVSLYDCGIVVLEIMTHLSLIPILISFFFLLTAMKFCELCFQTIPRVPSLVTISAAIILVQNHFLSEFLQ